MNIDDARYAWQTEFFSRYRDIRPAPQDFTLVACPGAGKTRAVLKVAKEMLDTREINFLWIVAPTRITKKQWWRAANDEGIDIEWKWDNDEQGLAADMKGAAVTYAAVNMRPDLHRDIVSEAGRRTLVIFDEIHHATDSRDWGEAVKYAFDLVPHRISMSGTPYHAEYKISFLQYDDKELVKADYTFTYREAVTAQVCRSIYFPREGGTAEWEFNSKKYLHSTDDILSLQQQAQRRRALVSAGFGGIAPQARRILIDADNKLTQIRGDVNPRAGGLIVAMDKEHADAIASHIDGLRASGEMAGKGWPPVVVSGGDGRALDLIEEFKNSTERWLVSVRMVSEGVDIPRLYVGAYLTNISTLIYFEQMAGRLSRGEGNAFLFIPDDVPLVRFARALADQRAKALEIIRSRTSNDGAIDGSSGSSDSATGPGESADRTTLLDPFGEVPVTDAGGSSVPCDPDGGSSSNSGGGFVAGFGGQTSNAGIIAPGSLGEDVIFDMHRIDRVEYETARLHLQGTWPGEVPHEVISRYVLDGRRRSGLQSGDVPEPDFTAAPLSQQKDRLKDAMNRLVGAYCMRNHQDYRNVNGWLNRQAGIRSMKTATLEQLQYRMQRVQGLNGL